MSTPETMTNCPSDETLAAFIDGRLDPEERRRVLEHSSACADCYSIASAAWDVQEANVLAPVVEGRFGSRKLWASVAGAFAAAAVIGFVFFYPPLHDRLFPPSGMDALVEASKSLEVRPSRARLSAEFPYREKRPVLRSGDDSVDDLKFANVWEAAARIQKKADANPSPANLHALGVAYLLVNDRKNAVAELVKAVKADSGTIEQSTNAALLNDLAAANQALADRSDANAQQLAKKAIERAWTLEHTPQTAWTRATVMQSLGNREQAIKAWRDYLAIDRDSPWRPEAEKQLNDLLQSGDTD